MFLTCELGYMKNFNEIQVTKTGSLGRTSKFIIMSSTLTVIVSLVGLRAGATTSNYTPAKLTAHAVLTISNSGASRFVSSSHHGKEGGGTTRVLTPEASTTTSAPTPSGTTTSTSTTPTSTISVAPATIAPPSSTTSAPPTTLETPTTTSPAPVHATPTPVTTTPPVTTTTVVPVASLFPLGVPSNNEPSGMSPPSAGALPGYTQSYVTDFSGTSLPSGWYTYSGNPGGDPGAQWSASHVVVANGMLSLNAWQDPAYNNSWVTGGLCQCDVAKTYGAYFVRSRLTGSGATGVELLWPAANVWPPEIDFNETFGSTTGTSATVHYNANNQQIHNSVKIDMTQWHTWGVIWTPTSITYTVDGKVWASVTNTSAIPNQAMTLDLQQQTWCGSGWACPSSPQSMQVDWVAEYSAS